MLESYLSAHHPDGQVRKARVSHICNGSLDGLDPGCGAQIMVGENYFDTGQRDDKFRAGRFCKYCAMIASREPDLFPIADDRPDMRSIKTKGGLSAPVNLVSFDLVLAPGDDDGRLRDQYPDLLTLN